MPTEITQFLQQALSQQSRSTVLKPLGWIVTILSAASIWSFSVPSPLWLGTFFGIFAMVSTALYLVAYIYFALTDKDALRSEKFYLHKMALQKGFVGDDSSGYIKVVETLRGTLHQLPEPASEDDK